MMQTMYNTKLFTDVYSKVEDFISDFHTCGIPSKISDTNASTLYYLLYAKYGNNPIANYDLNQFKYKLFAIVFQYGPGWSKRLEIQDRLISMKESEMLQGQKFVSNTALNPDQEPGTEELAYISNQNVNKTSKSLLGAYGEIWELLKLDVTQSFITQFKDLFKVVVMPEQPLLYTTMEDEEDGES